MKKLFYLLPLFCLLPFCLWAQGTMINGRVTDSATGAPIAGVSVELHNPQGKTSGTLTSADGAYAFKEDWQATRISFTSVGHLTVEQAVDGRQVIDVVMTMGDNTLNDVVVVGYGTQKKVNLTGAVATISNKELTVTKNENVLNMLTGKIPGLRMVQKTAEPGSYENSFDIRGYGGSPLVVIDGVPRGGLERMDPNEIESISVLKDGAAAIYGVNGGNGVILVTTRKGASKDGKFDINYSINQTYQQFLGMPEGVGPVDYMMLTNEKAKRDFATNFIANAAPAFSYDNIMAWVNGDRKGANWADAAFHHVSPQIQHNVNIAGGTDKINAFVNLGYMKQSGLLRSGDLDYDRWNLRSNVNIKITDRLRAQLLLSAVQDEKNQPYQDLWTIFKYAWNQIPTNEIYANGNPDYLNVVPDNINPVAVTDASKVGYKKAIERNVQAQGVLEYDIPGIKGLTAKGMFNYGYVVNDNAAYNKSYSLYAFNAEDSTYSPSVVNSANTALPFLRRTYGTSYSTLSQLSLNYQNTFNSKHHVEGLVVFEESHFKSDNIYAQRSMPLPVDYLFGGLQGDGEQGSTSPNGVQEIATRSILGRANYDYMGKYLAEFTFRRDGSNKFMPGPNQWGFFPSVSAGWRISEEDFFKSFISSEVISNLKLRASYGVMGTAAPEAEFQYLSGYTYPTVDPADNIVYGYMMDGRFVTGTATRGLANEDLTWYTAKTTNIGLDFSLFNGKVDGTVEVFRRDLSDLLAKRTVQLPGTIGAQLPFENLDSRRTQGIEGNLTYKANIGKVAMRLGGNASITRTRNMHATEGAQGNQYQQWRNGRMNRVNNIVWGLDYGGQYTSYDQIYNNPVNAGGGNNTVLPGDYYMQDWNEDGVINQDDYHPIAVQDLPLINFGLTINLGYKGFDLNALFAGSAGVWTEYGEQLGQPLMYGRSALAKFLDSWHTLNPDDNVFDPNTQWVSGKYPSMGYNYGQIERSTKGVINASYVRLKSLEIGYTLPHSLLNKVGIKNLRVYVNGYNLLTFSGLDDGVDPEHPGSFPDAGFDQALGGYKYPLNRTFNIGGSITF